MVGTYFVTNYNNILLDCLRSTSHHPPIALSFLSFDNTTDYGVLRIGSGMLPTSCPCEVRSTMYLVLVHLISLSAMIITDYRLWLSSFVNPDMAPQSPSGVSSLPPPGPPPGVEAGDIGPRARLNTLACPPPMSTSPRPCLPFII